ncbi:hypothetical protein [Clostridium sp. C2-6-12]|uniref:hypothetical protein n=1 Tax=Clostridium sp. C2-6-12 TaxID=2698832 RepID=UPI001369A73C|nr:hypothetical protein [Clostridium sp. C2-6-12]
MKGYFYLLAIGAYIISFLICFNICLKLDVEKFINSKISRRIGMILASFIISIAGVLIIDSLNIAREYQLMVKGFFVYGPTTSLLVWALPVKSNRNQS